MPAPKQLHTALPSELNAQLQAHFNRTRKHFKRLGAKSPEAIVLGGGYGRGEGGIATTPEGAPGFFNDLDYFIFSAQPQAPELLNAVHDWEVEESKIMGIDVEGKCLPPSDLAETSTSMMFYDLVTANTIVTGPDDYFDAYKALATPETIAPIEATRLLWNRGSGLLYAKSDLAQGNDPAIIHRNQSKVKLALGDAYLCIQGRYRAYVRERSQLLQESSDIPAIVSELHTEGTAFKLRPTTAPPLKELQATQATLTPLWIEAFLKVETERLNVDFAHPDDYIHFPGKLFPHTSSLRNCALHIRDRLKRGGGLKPATDYPRGALQRSLLSLLEDTPDYTQVSKQLGKSVQTLSQATQSYMKWWHHYS